MTEQARLIRENLELIVAWSRTPDCTRWAEEALGALVRLSADAVEREECAKIADTHASSMANGPQSWWTKGYQAAAHAIADAIRARTVLHSAEGKQPSPTGEAGK